MLSYCTPVSAFSWTMPESPGPNMTPHARRPRLPPKRSTTGLKPIGDHQKRLCETNNDGECPYLQGCVVFEQSCTALKATAF